MIEVTVVHGNMLNQLLCYTMSKFIYGFCFFDRAEELETALMEMVKQDNRRVLSARVCLMHIKITMFLPSFSVFILSFTKRII